MASSPNVPNMRVCAIDIGTNSTRYMIADLDRHARRITVLFQGTQLTRLGAGIGSEMKIREENASKTLEAVQKYYTYALSLSVSDFRIFGTAILREAANGMDFCRQVAEFTGVPVLVIDGQHEARLTEAAIAHSLGLEEKPFYGLDIGGGSAQLLHHVPGAASTYASLPLGAVRLTEKFLKSDPPSVAEMQALREHVQSALGAKRPAASCPIIAVGGTATTAAAMAQRLKTYDHAKIHGCRVSKSQWEEMLNTLEKIPAARRTEIPGLQKGREDIIVAGLLVLNGFAEHLAVKEITVSDRGVLYGTLVEYLDEMIGKIA